VEEQIVGISRLRARSAPVYVDTGEGVVSLVYEVEVTEGHAAMKGSQVGFRAKWPLAVYVLDDTGVQRLGFGASARPFMAIGLAFLLGPLQWALIGRRRQHRG
jgi:hypothetical protein